MYVVVAYDVRDDRRRERLRRLLWRYGLSPISKSVYAGRLGWDKARRLAAAASELLGPSDTLVVLPLQDSEFRRAILATMGYVSRRLHRDVIVVDGKMPQAALEEPRRATSVQDEGLLHGEGGEVQPGAEQRGGSPKGEGGG